MVIAAPRPSKPGVGAEKRIRQVVRARTIGSRTTVAVRPLLLGVVGDDYAVFVSRGPFGYRLTGRKWAKGDAFARRRPALVRGLAATPSPIPERMEAAPA